MFGHIGDLIVLTLTVYPLTWCDCLHLNIVGAALPQEEKHRLHKLFTFIYYIWFVIIGFKGFVWSSWNLFKQYMYFKSFNFSQVINNEFRSGRTRARWLSKESIFMRIRARFVFNCIDLFFIKKVLNPPLGSARHSFLLRSYDNMYAWKNFSFVANFFQ